MNKKMKIITLILSCVLLIGAAVGITVSAEQNTPVATVKLEGQNISYEGAVRVAYYLSTANLGKNQSVKLLVSDKKFDVPANITTPTGYIVKDVEDKVEFKDKDGNVTATYDIAYSDGIAPKELRDDIYAMAVVVDENGDVVARSLKKIYSPYKYAMNRFNALNKLNPEPETQEAIQKFDQLNLYTALLNYGGAVQDVLGYNAAAGSYADEYIVVNQKTFTNGVEADTSFAIRGTTLDLENRVEYKYEASRWQKIYDKDGNLESENKKVIFTGFTNADGESYLGENYSANWNKITLTPGNHTINAIYATVDGQYVTYAGATPVGSAGTLDDYADEYHLTAVSGTYTDYTKNSDAYKTYTLDGYTYKYAARGQALVRDGKLVFERSAVVIEVTDAKGVVDTTAEDYAGKWKVGDVIDNSNAGMGAMVNGLIDNPTMKTDKIANTVAMHVYETDISASFTQAGGNGHIGQFFMMVKNEATTFNTVFWSVNIQTEDGETYYLSVNFPNATAYNDSNKLVNYAQTSVEKQQNLVSGLKQNQVYNLRVEYLPNALGEGTMLVRFYLDGKLLKQYMNSYDQYGTATTLSQDGIYDGTRYLDGNFVGVRYGIPINGRDCHFYLDNTYIATDYETKDYLGRGKYTNVAFTETFEDEAHSFGGSYGTYASAEDLDAAKQAETIKGSYHTYHTDESGNTYYEHYVKNNSDKNDITVTPYFYSTNKTGDTYVFATDFKWNGAEIDRTATGTDGREDPWFLRIGFRSVGSTKGGDDTLFYIHAASKQGTDADDPSKNNLYLKCDGKSSAPADGIYHSNVFAVLERDIWYNIRIEYTPISIEPCEVKVNVGTSKEPVYEMQPGYTSKGQVDVYINGDIAYSTTTVANELTTSSNNLTFDHAYIQGRGAAASGKYGVRDYSYCLDNVYCNAISKSLLGSEADDFALAGKGYQGITYDGIESISADNDGFDFTGSWNYNEDVTTQLKEKTSSTSKTTYITKGVKNWTRIATEGDNKVLEIGKHTNVSGTTTWDAAKTEGSMYVFSTDLKWLGTSAVSSYSDKGASLIEDNWVLKIGLASSACKDDNRDHYLIPILGYTDCDNNLELSIGFGVNKIVLAVIEAGEWHDLTVEYVPMKDGNNSVGKVTVRIDEKIVYDGIYSGKTSLDNSDFTSTWIEWRGFAENTVARFDNTFVSAIDVRSTDNENATTFTDGIDYADKVYFKNQSYTNTRVEAVDGDNAIVVEKLSESVADYSANATFRNAGQNMGNTYVFDTAIRLESDVTWVTDPGADNWTTKLAFQSRKDNTNGASFFQILLYPKFGEDGKVSYYQMVPSGGSSAGVMAQIAPDVWSRIRVEYTPVTSTSADIKFYLNGGFVGELNNYATITSDGSKISNETYRQVVCEQRTHGSYISTAFDNVVMGIADELVHQATASFNGDGTDTLTYTPSKNRDGLLTVTEDGYLNFTLNRYLEDGSVNPAWTADTGNWRITFNLPDATVLGHTQLGSVYSMEYKVRINDLQNCADKVTNWWCYSGITATDKTAWTEDNASFSSNGLDSSNVAKIHGITLTKGEWISVHQTFRISAVDETTGGYTIQYTTYINGTLSSIGTTTHAGKKVLTDDVLCCGFMFRGCNNSNGKMDSINVDFDDIVFSSYNTVVDAPAETPAE